MVSKGTQRRPASLERAVPLRDARPKRVNARYTPDSLFEDEFDWPELDAHESGKSRLAALAGPLAVLLFLDVALGFAFLVRESTVRGGIGAWLAQSQLPGPELIATVVIVAALALFISIVVHVGVTSRASNQNPKAPDRRSVVLKTEANRRKIYW